MTRKSLSQFVESNSLQHFTILMSDLLLSSIFKKPGKMSSFLLENKLYEVSDIYIRCKQFHMSLRKILCKKESESIECKYKNEIDKLLLDKQLRETIGLSSKLCVSCFGRNCKNTLLIYICIKSFSILFKVVYLCKNYWRYFADPLYLSISELSYIIHKEFDIIVHLIVICFGS